MPKISANATNQGSPDIKALSAYHCPQGILKHQHTNFDSCSKASKPRIYLEKLTGLGLLSLPEKQQSHRNRRNTGIACPESPSLKGSE